MTVRVLVVEDEAVAARAHRTYVEGVDEMTVVATARTLAEAIRTLTSEPVDLVLLDMQLPDGHGLDLLRRLRGGGHPVHVIAVTAARDIEVVRQASAQGVVGYVIKPFTRSTLESKLRGYLDFRTTLSTDTEVDQTTVDAAFAAFRLEPDAGLPKGLSPERLVDVRELVRAADGEVTAGLAAERLDIARVTARRYLEHLVDLHELTRGHRSGGSGRPTVVYRAPRRNASPDAR